MVALNGATLLIRSADEALTREWPCVRVRAHVDPGGSVTFRSGDTARLVVDDADVLRALRPHIRHWPKQPGGWRFVLWSAGAFVGAAALMILAAPSVLAPLIPPTWEDAAGAPLQRSILAAQGQCTGPEGQRALDRFAERMAASAKMPPARIAVANDGVVNAFALPGDRILLERGLIDAAADGEELAGVLAHEMGHIAHRDPTRALFRQFGFSLVAAALGWTPFSTGNIAGTLLDLSYSRAAETAADAFSVTSLRDAGLRADGLGRFFGHMEREVPSGPSFLSDHPATADRRARVVQPDAGEPAFAAAEWQAIRSMCPRG